MANGHGFVCVECGETKPALAYHKRSNRGIGRNTKCRDCVNAKKRDSFDSQQQRWYLLKARYNLTQERWAEIFAAQGEACPICGTKEPGGKGDWHVDHDHSCCEQAGRSCGKCVRGLLCHMCNTALGGFRDDVSTLMSAAAYLMSSSNVLEVQDAAG